MVPLLQIPFNNYFIKATIITLILVMHPIHASYFSWIFNFNPLNFLQATTKSLAKDENNCTTITTVSVVSIGAIIAYNFYKLRKCGNVTIYQGLGKAEVEITKEHVVDLSESSSYKIPGCAHIATSDYQCEVEGTQDLSDITGIKQQESAFLRKNLTKTQYHLLKKQIEKN